MNMNTTVDPVEHLLANGLKNLWFPVLPSDQLGEKPVSIRRLGYKIALWRDNDGSVHALEDHCPHRGAPLSQGPVLGDRLQCPYHGVEVRCDGTVTKVPGSPGCKLEGSRPTRMFHTREAAGAIFLFNAAEPHVDTPPELVLPEQLSSPNGAASCATPSGKATTAMSSTTSWTRCTALTCTRCRTP